MIEIDTPYFTGTVDNANFGREILRVFKHPYLPDLPVIEKWRIMRKIRNDLLDRIDLTYCNAERWEGLTAIQKAKIKAIKQHLRDITQTFSNPEDVTVPEITT